MIDLGLLPLADLGVEVWERFARAVRDDVIKEGRAAYLVGIPYVGVPPFKAEDMTVFWQCGWRWEKEAQEARKAKGT